MVVVASGVVVVVVVVVVVEVVDGGTAEVVTVVRPVMGVSLVSMMLVEVSRNLLRMLSLLLLLFKLFKLLFLGAAGVVVSTVGRAVIGTLDLGRVDFGDGGDDEVSVMGEAMEDSELLNDVRGRVVGTGIVAAMKRTVA